MDDPISSEPVSLPDTNQDSPQPTEYMVRHNDKIVGIFANEFDAADALHGYQMENDIGLDDVLDVLQIL